MNILQSILKILAPPIVRLISRASLPQTRGSLRVEELSAPVEVLRDRWGVPHITAQTMADLCFAQGFVHAQERLWQMDLQRRLPAGRLAEIFGKGALPADRWMRILGLDRVAADEVKTAHPDDRSILEAYCAGVNAWIARRRLPVEFSLLAYQPEPYTPADALGWSKMVALNLACNWDSELLRQQIIQQVGEEAAAELEMDAADAWPLTLKLPDMLGVDGHPLREARSFTGPGAAEGVGSNNWVVAGSRTASGNALLANDMHLALDVPAMWFENHLECPGFRVTGVSLPGVPLVIAGHNGRVAWGFTAGFADTQDLFEEHVRQGENGLREYEHRGKWLPLRVRHEMIRVKGGDPVEMQVELTGHGPLINPLVTEDLTLPPLALRWSALDPDPEQIHALLLLNQANTCAEVYEALRGWNQPVLNVVYADVHGEIGYSLAGKVPIRAQGNGSVPAPGWRGEFEWTGWIPYDEQPHLRNPTQGYVATANNRTTGVDYPYYLSRDYIRGDRAERIVELILQNPRMDTDSIRRMQYDQVSASAREIAGILGGLVSEDEEVAQACAMLRAWDGHLGVDSPAAAIYEVCVRELMFLLLEKRLGKLLPAYLSKPLNPIAGGNLFGEHANEWLRGILRRPDSSWFDLGGGQTREDALRMALRRAVDMLKQRLGTQMESWRWGSLHRLTLRHTLSMQPALAPAFNLGPFPTGGDGSTIWAAFFAMYKETRDVTVGPPFRFIADLGDLDHCLGMLIPGQSGHPASRHYADQVQDWYNGGYHTMLFARKDVEEGCSERLELHPATHRQAKG